MFIRIHYLLSCVKLPTLYKFPLCFPHELLTTFGSNSSKYDTEVFTGISKSECSLKSRAFLMHSGFVVPVKSDVEYLNWLLKPTSTLKYFKSTSTLKYFKGTSTLNHGCKLYCFTTILPLRTKIAVQKGLGATCLFWLLVRGIPVPLQIMTYFEPCFQ